MSVKYSSRYEISMTSALLPKMILMGESTMNASRTLAQISHFQNIIEIPGFHACSAGIVIFTLCVLLSRKAVNCPKFRRWEASLRTSACHVLRRDFKYLLIPRESGRMQESTTCNFSHCSLLSPRGWESDR